MPTKKKDLFIETKIVGVSFKNPDGSSRQEKVALLQKGDTLALVREPKNKYDKNAIAVRLTARGRQLGYLSREVAQHFADAVDKKTKLTAKVVSTGQAPNGNWGASVKVEWRG